MASSDAVTASVVMSHGLAALMGAVIVSQLPVAPNDDSVVSFQEQHRDAPQDEIRHRHDSPRLEDGKVQLHWRSLKPLIESSVYPTTTYKTVFDDSFMTLLDLSEQEQETARSLVTSFSDDYNALSLQNVSEVAKTDESRTLEISLPPSEIRDLRSRYSARFHEEFGDLAPLFLAKLLLVPQFRGLGNKTIRLHITRPSTNDSRYTVREELLDSSGKMISGSGTTFSSLDDPICVERFGSVVPRVKF